MSWWVSLHQPPAPPSIGVGDLRILLGGWRVLGDERHHIVGSKGLVWHEAADRLEAFCHVAQGLPQPLGPIYEVEGRLTQFRVPFAFHTALTQAGLDLGERNGHTLHNLTGQGSEELLVFAINHIVTPTAAREALALLLSWARLYPQGVWEVT